MVRILCAALLLSAVPAAASPALVSFESSVGRVRAAIGALRAEQIHARAGNIGPQLDNMAWDLQRYERDTADMRRELSYLLSRVRRHRLAPGLPTRPGQPNRPGRPGQPGDPDPSLRWDLQRFTRNLAQLARDSQWRLNDLRSLSAQAEKDQVLVAPATRLLDAARRFKSETNWLQSDARFAYFDLMRAGFTFEGMDLDRDSRAVDQSAQDLQNEADRLLAKVRP